MESLIPGKWNLLCKSLAKWKAQAPSLLRRLRLCARRWRRTLVTLGISKWAELFSKWLLRLLACVFGAALLLVLLNELLVLLHALRTN